MTISRRGFLGGSVALASLAACGSKGEPPAPNPDRPTAPGSTPPGSSAASHAPAARSPDQTPSAKPSVIDVRGTDPAKMVAAALAALGGIEDLVGGKHVVIKPNGAFAAPPEWGVTTHPETVAAMVRACLDARAADVRILEYPGRGHGETCLERCGITAALAGLPRVTIEGLNGGSAFRKVAIEGGTELTEVPIAAALLDADVLINLPAAKAHRATKVSFGMKNAMGLIHNRRRLHDLDLDRAIADLARVIRPDLTLLDATRALLDNGPGGPGTTVTPGRMIAGRDVVAVDAVGLTTANFNHKQLTASEIPHIARAGEIGLGVIDLDRIELTTIET